jgi:hypothetical protein
VVRKTVRKYIDKAKSRKFKTVADNFFNGAEVAKEYEYWNAAGVLIVHAAIALADAVTIKVGGVKSQGENHYELITLIDELITGSHQKQNALKQLRQIIDHKNSVSYNGDIYDKKDVDKLWKHLMRFRNRALDFLK